MNFILTGASPAGDSALTLNNEEAAATETSLFQIQREAAMPPPTAATVPAKAAAPGRGILCPFRLL